MLLIRKLIHFLNTSAILKKISHHYGRKFFFAGFYALLFFIELA